MCSGVSKISLPAVVCGWVRSMAAVLFLFIYCILLPLLFVGFVLGPFCYAVLCVLCISTIISLEKRGLVAVLLLSSGNPVAVIIICLFPAMPKVGLVLCNVIVAFHSHTYLLFLPDAVNK